jgi:hypothetical protein
MLNANGSPYLRHIYMRRARPTNILIEFFNIGDLPAVALFNRTNEEPMFITEFVYYKCVS